MMLSALFTLFALLSVLDGVTTYQALHRTGTRESNPLMAFLFERIGIIPALAATKSAAIAAVWYTMGPYSLWVLVCVNTFYAAVVWRNHAKVGR